MRTYNKPDFHDNYIPEPMSGCWLWVGAFKNCYALFNGTVAHRISVELHHGPIPVGMVIDHKCRTKSCVNPSHLEIVTPKENTLRGIGPTAKNAAKTHCINGHPLSGDNVMIFAHERGKTMRGCVTCRRKRSGDFSKKRSAKLKAEIAKLGERDAEQA